MQGIPWTGIRPLGGYGARVRNTQPHRIMKRPDDAGSQSVSTGPSPLHMNRSYPPIKVSCILAGRQESFPKSVELELHFA
jgi:hypothetical protein